MRERITSEDAKQRILRNFELLRRDYDSLWRRYAEVVHENALLNAENDRLRRSAERV